MSVPGGIGGLVRYDSEYKSRFNMSPMQVVVFIILVAIFVIGLKIFWPIAG